jgi:hypothetical protein
VFLLHEFFVLEPSLSVHYSNDQLLQIQVLCWEITQELGQLHLELLLLDPPQLFNHVQAWTITNVLDRDDVQLLHQGIRGLRVVEAEAIREEGH